MTDIVSWEMVDAIRSVCDDAERWCASHMWDDEQYATIALVREAAERIATLLPPRA